jgi:hypothetical protein
VVSGPKPGCSCFFSAKAFASVFHVHGSPRSVRGKLPPTQTGKHGFHPPVPCFASSHVYFIYYYYRNTLSWRGKARCRLPSASLHVCFPPVPTAVALPRDRSSSFLGRADHAARAAERCAADGAKGAIACCWRRRCALSIAQVRHGMQFVSFPASSDTSLSRGATFPKAREDPSRLPLPETRYKSCDGGPRHA